MASIGSAGMSRQIEDGIWLIDTLYVGEPGIIASYLLEGDDGLALVDVGSAATIDTLLAAVRASGHDTSAIQHLVLTHVHLDHAGASGGLTRVLPDARVYVHPLGAPHLIDPARLIASATRIYGDDMQRMWGTTEPVPADRLVVVGDGDELRVAGRTLRALHTPGHAVHHIAYYDGERGALFAGDVTGVRMEGVSYVRPPTPPPDLSLEDWSHSLARLRTLPLEHLYLPHFGVVGNVEAHLRELETRLYVWGEFVAARMRAGKDTAAIAEDLALASDPEVDAAARGRDEVMRRRYELATNYRMTVQGYERYYRKQYPDLAQPAFL